MEESVADGPGVRMVVFMQGCPHHCAGCHNPHTHDPAGGEWADTEDILRRFKAKPLLAGLTLSGGEPVLQAAAAAALARGVKGSGKNVLLYSGYTLEKLQALSREDEDIARLLAYTDTLIDGPYIEAERDLSLAFRGSRNQRIIIRSEFPDPKVY
jgi:anaerobic ribonucleoside-triphosphate reductase activating protein